MRNDFNLSNFTGLIEKKMILKVLFIVIDNNDPIHTTS